MVHPRVGLKVPEAQKILHPKLTLISHLHELHHPYNKWRWPYSVGFEEIDKGKVSRSIKIKSTSDSIMHWMTERLKAIGMEEVEKYKFSNYNILGIAGNGIAAGIGDNIFIMRCEFPPSQLYMERHKELDDGKARMPKGT